MKRTVLRELFAAFLRARRFGRHFRRLALFESLAGTQVSRELPPALAQELIAAATSDSEGLLAKLESHADGLSDIRAAQVRERFGLNEVEHEKPLPWWVHLWHCYRTPFSILLTVLAVVSYLTEDMKATIVIGSMVVLATLVRFVQERKSNQAADKLKAMVSTTATVLRRDAPPMEAVQETPRRFQVRLHPKAAQRVELPIKMLVPGDVIMLSAGDMIPADCRVLSAQDLFMNQSAMTGESLPVEKFAQLRNQNTTNPLELEDILFMGTNVVSGSATAVAVATGNRTYFGTLAQRATTADRAPTHFQAGVNQVAWLLIRFMFVMAPLGKH